VQKKSFENQTEPRVPIKINGTQVNFCKNPTCENYGVPAKGTDKRVRTRAQDKDQYSFSGGKSSLKVLKCLYCEEYPPIKSNLAINEELERMISDITPLPEPSCLNEDCENHNTPISVGISCYQAFGQTRSGSKRYCCKSCKKTFSVSKSTNRQRLPHKNKIIFSLLMNKSPFKRICEIAEINPTTLYQRIDFLYQQCLNFSADRESKLIKGKKLGVLKLSLRQSGYLVHMVLTGYNLLMKKLINPLWGITVLVIVLLIISFLYLGLYLTVFVRENAEDEAVIAAQATANQYKALRGYYTTKVIKKILDKSDLVPAFDHEGDPDKVPLPATMIHDLSDLMKNDRIVLKLYSEYPFPNRDSNRLDDFERSAWTALNDSDGSSKPFIRTEIINGRRMSVSTATIPIRKRPKMIGNWGMSVEC